MAAEATPDTSKGHRHSIEVALRVAILLSLALSLVCAFYIAAWAALVPLLLLCWVAWFQHLPTRRRTVASLLRYTSLVASQVVWCMLLGALLEMAVTSFLPHVGPWVAEHPIRLGFFLPYVIPMSSTFGWRKANQVLFRVMLDLPFLGVVMFYHYVWKEKLNSLATKITEHVYLGSLPFSSDVGTLKSLGITHVINMCAEWSGPAEQYKAAGIEQLRLPSTDGLPPAMDKLSTGVAFAADCLKEQPDARIFVHCRFGMGRSATMALAILVAVEGWELDAAMQHMKTQRPEVTSSVATRVQQWLNTRKRSE